jgi:hypothetical protein
MGERARITRRELHSRDDADDLDWLSGFPSFCVEELNHPSECVVSRPQLLRERVVDDRDPLSGAGSQFGVPEITASRHGKSEHPRDARNPPYFLGGR